MGVQSVDSIEVGDAVAFEKTLTKDDVDTFAELSGDRNPLHIDEDKARNGRFGRPVCHGVLVTGLISAALARLPGTVIYLSQTTEFVAPAYVGGEFKAVCEVIEKDEREHTLTTKVVDDDGDEVVIGTAVVLVEYEE